jgi:hypothetical protein
LFPDLYVRHWRIQDRFAALTEFTLGEIRRQFLWLFRILYVGFTGLNEFSKLSALSYSP